MKKYVAVDTGLNELAAKLRTCVSGIDAHFLEGKQPCARGGLDV